MAHHFNDPDEPRRRDVPREGMSRAQLAAVFLRRLGSEYGSEGILGGLIRNNLIRAADRLDQLHRRREQGNFEWPDWALDLMAGKPPV